MPTAPQLGLASHSQNALPGVQVGGYVNKDYFGASLGEAAAEGVEKFAMVTERNRLVDADTRSSMNARLYGADVSAAEGRARAGNQGQNAKLAPDILKKEVDALQQKYEGQISDKDELRQFKEKSLGATFSAQTGITRYAEVEQDAWVKGQQDATIGDAVAESAKARVTSTDPLLHNIQDHRVAKAIEAKVLYLGLSHQEHQAMLKNASGGATYIEGQHYGATDDGAKLKSLLDSPRAKDLSAEQRVSLERMAEGAVSRNEGLAAGREAAAAAIAGDKFHASAETAQVYLTKQFPDMDERTREVAERSAVRLLQANDASNKKGTQAIVDDVRAKINEQHRRLAAGEVYSFDNTDILQQSMDANPEHYRYLAITNRVGYDALVKYAKEGDLIYNHKPTEIAAWDAVNNGTFTASDPQWLNLNASTREGMEKASDTSQGKRDEILGAVDKGVAVYTAGMSDEDKKTVASTYRLPMYEWAVTDPTKRGVDLQLEVFRRVQDYHTKKQKLITGMRFTDMPGVNDIVVPIVKAENETDAQAVVNTALNWGLGRSTPVGPKVKELDAIGLAFVRTNHALDDVDPRVAWEGYLAGAMVKGVNELPGTVHQQYTRAFELLMKDFGKRGPWLKGAVKDSAGNTVGVKEESNPYVRGFGLPYGTPGAGR